MMICNDKWMGKYRIDGFKYSIMDLKPASCFVVCLLLAFVVLTESIIACVCCSYSLNVLDSAIFAFQTWWRETPHLLIPQTMINISCSSTLFLSVRAVSEMDMKRHRAWCILDRVPDMQPRCENTGRLPVLPNIESVIHF